MKKIFLIIVALIITLALFWAALPTQQPVSENLTKLEDYIPALMTEAAIPGLAIARIKNGQTVLMQTYGKANVETGTAVSKDTLFNLASISKPIMGLVLLQLVDQGKLDLDQDINHYLPFKIDNPHTNNERITLRHLASHSTGIADYYDIQSYAQNRDADTTLEQHLKSLLLPAGSNYQQGAHFLPQQPGSQRQYSNLAAGLAGYLVEASSGLSLANYSKQRLFPALGMTKSSWLLHDLSLANIAVPYEVEQCVPYLPRITGVTCADTEAPELNELISRYIKPPAANKHFRSYPHFGNPQYPDGGLRSSIQELSQLLVGILANKDIKGQPLLSDAMYKEMFNAKRHANLPARSLAAYHQFQQSSS